MRTVLAVGTGWSEGLLCCSRYRVGRGSTVLAVGTGWGEGLLYLQ